MRNLMLAAVFIPTLSSAINAAPLDTFQDCDLCPFMIELPLGDFIMGAPEDEFRRNVTWYDGAYRPVTPEHQWVLPHEGPQRHVTVDIPVAMGRDEVTYDQWMACVNDGGCGGYTPPPELMIPADPNGTKAVNITGTVPVMWVDTADALLYIAWLNQKIGVKSYRLPNEAEWEYAARAGTTTRFAQGDTIDDQQANFSGKSTAFFKADPREDLMSRGAPVPVEDLNAANAWGLRHMSGNVSELTASCFTEQIPDLALTSQWQAESKTTGCMRVIRGGAFFGPLDTLRVASRPPLRRGGRTDFVGFRVIKVIEAKE